MSRPFNQSGILYTTRVFSSESCSAVEISNDDVFGWLLTILSFGTAVASSQGSGEMSLSPGTSPASLLTISPIALCCSITSTIF